MRPIIRFNYGRARCPLCLADGGSRKEHKSLQLIISHLIRKHSYGGNYHYFVSPTPTRNYNHSFTIRGTCGCGCGEPIKYSIPEMPDHGPPYYRSGHLSRVGLPNGGVWKKGDVPWNKGTKGVCKPNSGTFKKGNVPASDRGGNYTAPNGQNFVWNGGYQPSGPRKYIARSRVVMEEVLGRPLLPSEIVIHLDYNTSNDDPGNLKVITRGENAVRNRWKGHTAKKKTKKKIEKKAVVPEVKKATVPKIEKAAVPEVEKAAVPRSSHFCPECGTLMPLGRSCPRC